MQTPYIGVTGFMSQDEVNAVLDVLPENSERLLMAGVLASKKTVFLGLESKWPNRYPNPEDIASIFPNHPNVLNFVHYNTKDTEGELLEQMLGVAEIAGPNFHGFQLNVAWPEPEALALYRVKRPNDRIVLQVGSGALAVVGGSPTELAFKVAEEYESLVDYVLLDPSGGRGQSFDAERAHAYLTTLRSHGVELIAGLGVAGGLSPTTLNLLEPLIDPFPDVSIDAEGRLRDEGDVLDVNVAQMYAAQALRMFGQ